MNRSYIRIVSALAGLAICATTATARGTPVSTAFTYQGQLKSAGVAANGSFDFQFQLFDASSGGSQVGFAQFIPGVAVTDGLFTTPVDFGAQYQGQSLFLQISVRPAGSGGAYSPLATRQPLTAAPFAQALRLPVAESGVSSGSLLSFTNTDPNGDGMRITSETDSGLVPLFRLNTAIVANSGTGNGLIAATSAASAWGLWSIVNGNSSQGLHITHSGSSGYGGVIGISNAASSATGLLVSTSGTGDVGVFTISNATSTSQAIQATSSGLGSVGTFAATNAGSAASTLLATTNGSGATAVEGTATGSSGIGVQGTGLAAGVQGDCSSSGGYGVYGISHATNNGAGNYVPAGVRGDASFAGVAGVEGFNNFGSAIYGQTSSGYGIYASNGGSNSSGYAGYFNGRVHIQGTLSKSSGSFKIDHPLDPEHKFLYHSFVESPDMKNIYDGTAVVGDDGTATVTMPDWFEALNMDFRYQLTCIGAHAPVYVSSEMSHNTFTIAGGKPGMKISWQVTGTRHDAYANYHRIAVEENKVGTEDGKYLCPEGFGKPDSLRIGNEHGEPANKGVVSSRH